MSRNTKAWAVIAICLAGAAWWAISSRSGEDRQKPNRASASTAAQSASEARPDSKGSFLNPQIGAVENQAGRPGVKSTDFEPTIAGIDANKNGVRDDIERYIEKTYPDPAQRAAMMQYAIAQQEEILNGTTREKELVAAQKTTRALECAYRILGFKYHDAANDILAMTVNTEARYLAYAKSRDNLGGQILDQYSGDKPCE